MYVFEFKYSFHSIKQVKSKPAGQGKCSLCRPSISVAMEINYLYLQVSQTGSTEYSDPEPCGFLLQELTVLGIAVAYHKGRRLNKKKLGRWSCPES